MVAQNKAALRSVNNSEIFLPSTSSNQKDSMRVGNSVRLNMSIVRKMSMPKLATLNLMLERVSSSENLKKRNIQHYKIDKVSSSLW